MVCGGLEDVLFRVLSPHVPLGILHVDLVRGLRGRAVQQVHHLHEALTPVRILDRSIDGYTDGYRRIDGSMN